MGNQLASSQQPEYNNLPDIGSALTFQERLGGGRFLKTLKCVNEDGILVVKVYFKRDPGLSLASYEEMLTEVRRRRRRRRGAAPPLPPPPLLPPPLPPLPSSAADPPIGRAGLQGRRAPSSACYATVTPCMQVRAKLTVNGAPNVMPFRWFKESPHAAYLVRQYFHANLLERLSSPPFLSLIEKKWLAFQLLQAVQQCHAAGVCHGDIKAENVPPASTRTCRPPPPSRHPSGALPAPRLISSPPHLDEERPTAAFR